MARNYPDRLGLLQIPQNHLEVSARRDHDILSGRVPLDLVDLPLMPMQVHDPLGEILAQAMIPDLPHLDGGVLGARGNLVVVERIPLDVEDRPAVSAYLRHVDVDAARLLERYDNERPATALLGHDGNELRVDRAEGRVVRRILRYLDVLVADVLFVRVAVHVPIL